MTAPHVSTIPSNWNTHQDDPEQWFKSVKAELRKIERRLGRK